MRLGAVRHLFDAAPLYGRNGPIDTQQVLDHSLESDHEGHLVVPTLLPEEYASPKGLPTGIVDSVLIGQELHENMFAPDLGRLFCDGS